MARLYLIKQVLETMSERATEPDPLLYCARMLVTLEIQRLELQHYRSLRVNQ